MRTLTEQFFDDDVARDIAVDFDRLTLSGKSPSTAAEQLLRQWSDAIGDQAGGPVVILALAQLLLDSRIRNHRVLDRAEELIQKEAGLDRWTEMGQKTLESRKRVYDSLVERIRAAKAIHQKVSPAISRRMPQVGDVVQIPLETGQFAYAHYVHDDPVNGPLIQILRQITNEPAEQQSLDTSRLLVPPLIAGIGAAVKEGTWQVIGKRPVVSFKYPLFKYGLLDKQGNVPIWWLWDGRKMREVGPILPPEYEKLEMLQVYPAAMVEEKIISALGSAETK